MTTNKFCFLDMDGVLVDFVGGVSKAHNRLSPYSDPKSYGIFEMEKLWGITSEEFWTPTHYDGFWENLKKTPEADAMVELASRTFGASNVGILTSNVGILTSPSNDLRCITEKKLWIKKRYPQLHRNMLFGSAKRFLAGPGRVLIDDRDANIDNFHNHGGAAITFPQLWNKRYNITDAVAFVEMRLKDEGFMSGS